MNKIQKLAAKALEQSQCQYGKVREYLWDKRFFSSVHFFKVENGVPGSL